MSVDYGWLDRGSGDSARVGLVVQAAYHLDEFVPLRAALRERGIAAELLVPLPPKKPLKRFRPATRRFRELLAASDMTLEGPVRAVALTSDLTSIVVMNDWGMPKPLVESMRAVGKRTFAWVEGVQDFGDTDTGQSRGAYSHVDHVFCIGQHGADQLPRTEWTIVGSARLRALWFAPAGAAEAPLATVNTNFTYGVLTEHRRAWLSSVAAACSAAGMPWVLSRHAAERGFTLPHRASSRPIGELLDTSTHLIGRFSTVGYEALVRGVEFVYHNPHGERVPTFAESAGAFTSTDSAATLAASLCEPARPRAAVRAGAEEFLHHHLRLADGPEPAELAADVIANSIG